MFTYMHGEQEYDGNLNFATDAWTSPNQKAMIAFTVHFEHAGAPMSLVLDVLEVAMSHSGLNLASAFAKMLEGFELDAKVSVILVVNAETLTRLTRYSGWLVTMHPPTT